MKKLTVILIAVLALLLAACSAPVTEENEEDASVSTGYDQSQMPGEWVHDSDSLEVHSNGTFYDSRYELSGTWGESEDGGDVAFYYDGVPDSILSQGWDESDQYFEIYYFDNENKTLLDTETMEVRWTRFD